MPVDSKDQYKLDIINIVVTAGSIGTDQTSRLHAITEYLDSLTMDGH
jgi:hypothetical protein